MLSYEYVFKYFTKIELPLESEKYNKYFRKKI